MVTSAERRPSPAELDRLIAPGDRRDPQSPAYWDHVRSTPGALASGVETTLWLQHAAKAVAYCLQQVGAAQDGRGGSVLDVSAGTGWLGKLLKDAFPSLIYHATEQTPFAVAQTQQRLGSSVALWRCDPDGPSLRQTLGDSPAAFEPYYSLVLLHHVVDCVPHALGYRLLDDAWEMVQPADPSAGQGFLLVTIQRHVVHRVHEHPWDWNDVVGHLAQYSRPVLCFDDALGGSSVSGAIWRPPLDTPIYPAQGELRP